MNQRFYSSTTYPMQSLKLRIGLTIGDSGEIKDAQKVLCITFVVVATQQISTSTTNESPTLHSPEKTEPMSALE